MSFRLFFIQLLLWLTLPSVNAIVAPKAVLPLGAPNQPEVVDLSVSTPETVYRRNHGVGSGLRFYDPSIQRWINQDPIGELGGINLYGFVSNDPVNRFDPYGESDNNRPPAIVFRPGSGRLPGYGPPKPEPGGRPSPPPLGPPVLLVSDPNQGFWDRFLFGPRGPDGNQLYITGMPPDPGFKGVAKKCVQKAVGGSAGSGGVSGYTRHGLNQAIGRNGGRGVSAKAMLDALKNPKKVIRNPDGSVIYRGNKATVVVNADGKVVTTYGKSRGPQIWPQGTTRPSGSGSAQRRANKNGISYNPNAIR